MHFCGLLQGTPLLDPWEQLGAHCMYPDSNRAINESDSRETCVERGGGESVCAVICDDVQRRPLDTDATSCERASAAQVHFLIDSIASKARH